MEKITLGSLDLGMLKEVTARYQLGAGNGQFPNIDVSKSGVPLMHRAQNLDGGAQLNEIAVDKTSHGQPWQSGDHVVEVIDRTGSTVPFEIHFTIL